MIQKSLIRHCLLAAAIACQSLPGSTAFAFYGHSLGAPTKSRADTRGQGAAVKSKNRFDISSRSLVLKASTETDTTASDTGGSCIENSVGLYRPFAEHAWSKLMGDGATNDWFVEDTSVPSELLSNIAPAKGMPEGSVVKMTTRALVPSAGANKLVRYARYALLETLVPTTTSTDSSSDSVVNSTVGIQVLNLVIFPAASTNLPVFGADVVSLPGNRHLSLLDAQPMDNDGAEPRQYQNHWKDWHQQHVVGSSKKDDDKHSFPWGGDIPEKVAKYVSDYALWTRLVGGSEDDAVVDPVTKLQTDFYAAYQDHLDLYLDLLANYDVETKAESNNEQAPYVEYRLNNDPAKPMLKSLYGEEWTERILQEVLFPNVSK